MPVSSKTTLKCQLDALSITQRRYILRPASAFVSDSEFELTIPIKKPGTENWKLEKRGAALWAVVPVTDNKLETNGNEQLASNPGDSSSQHSPVISTVFGLKMYVKPIDEREYCVSAEFACAVSGTDCIHVQLPKGSSALNVQIERRSVRWFKNNAGKMVVPILTENDPVDVRIVYTAPFNRTLYTEPMKFEPPIIGEGSQPEILWAVLPWKNFSRLDPGVVRSTSFINQQIWLINDLNSQFLYLKNSAKDVSPIALERLSIKLDEIELQLKQYDNKKGKLKTKMDIVPTPENFRRLNDFGTGASTIRLAMQNILQLREAIALAAKKTGDNELHDESGSQKDFPELKSFSLIASNSSLTEGASEPLVGMSAPGTAFILNYALEPQDVPNASIWQMIALLFIPFIIWLTFFPPESFIPWRPSFILGCLSVIWLLYFNLYGTSALLFIIALFDALNKMRQYSKRNIIPLSVR